MGRLFRRGWGFTLETVTVTVFLSLTLTLIGSYKASAANPGPQSASLGLQATISSAPPSVAASITIPASGQVFMSEPITVSGLCPSDLVIKVYDNNAFVGSTVCSSGSFSLQINLFSGQNTLTAVDYDALDEAGPTSNTVNITFNNAQFIQTSSPFSLISAYAERGAAPGTELDWPIVLNGGSSPYAVSVDWGDGTPNDLISSSQAGLITLKHTYKEAGIYTVIVKATDKNGNTAFLQLIGQGTGAIQSNNTKAPSVVVEKQVEWIPALAAIPLVVLSFWAGGRHKLTVLKKRL